VTGGQTEYGPAWADTGRLLRRIERRSLGFAVVGTVVAWVVPDGGARLAAGVAGGAVLALVSYWAIRRGITGLADSVLMRVTRGSRTGDGDSDAIKGRTPRGVVMFVVRYALLAGIAYVMIARLRLAPLGLLCGASVVVLAVAAELVWQPRHRHR
jgi:hypothetical protein